MYCFREWEKETHLSSFVNINPTKKLQSRYYYYSHFTNKKKSQKVKKIRKLVQYPRVRRSRVMIKRI